MSEQPLHDYIDMEAYDVVSGETYRALKAEVERLRRMICDWLADMDSDMQQAFRAALSEEGKS